MDMIPENWVAAREPNAYRSKNGRAFAGAPVDLAFFRDSDYGAHEAAPLVGVG